METFEATPRTRVRILRDRGHYKKDLVYSILDEAPFCHLGFSIDEQPYVIPTIHARLGDVLYLHGNPASRMLRHLRAGFDACVTATLLDGLVLARSALHHSMNYRSAVVLGRAAEVTDRAEKDRALQAVVDHVVPGRWDEVRPPSPEESRKTLVLVLPIRGASAKVRNGPSFDDEGDYSLRVWAGVVPVRTQVLPPVSDARLPRDVPVPQHVLDLVTDLKPTEEEE